MSKEEHIPEHYDFSGWATKNNLRCTDGRVIKENAFAHNDGRTVPLVWNHQHNDPDNVLGHAFLRNVKDGVRAYGVFNNTESGQTAKELVHSGDVTMLSIFANQLQQKADGDSIAVLHGEIREVSLVLAGANPGAHIDSAIVHGEYSDEAAMIRTGDTISIAHSDKPDDENQNGSNNSDDNESEEKTVAEVLEGMSEEQKIATSYVVTQALNNETQSKETNKNNSEGGNEIMKHNVFDTEESTTQNVLSHADQQAIIKDGKRCGSLREAFIAHNEKNELTHDGTYGIDNVDYLFPDAKVVGGSEPTFIKRDTTWVDGIINGAHHTPFSRIKSIFANITEDEARAKGYIKGKLKKEEVFSLLKRSTTPQTVYKKQKMDRDDIVDITDFSVVAWLKGEMRTMLNEELARAALIGDGRLTSDDDHIKDDNIRPIWTDAELYTIKTAITVTSATSDEDKARAFIKACIKSRKKYKGSGNPTLYTTEDMLTEMLLLTDTTGRDLYESVEKLATKLRVKEIVTVPVMENQTREDGSDKFELGGIIVNIYDYTFGADKGGAVNLFEDFDIDYNQEKYLIETRCSGALTVPYSAIAVEFKTAKQAS